MSDMSSSSDKVQAGDDPTLDAIRNMVSGTLTEAAAPARDPATDASAPTDTDATAEETSPEEVKAATPAAEPAPEFDFAAMVAMSEALPEPETPDPIPAPPPGQHVVAAQQPAKQRAKKYRIQPDTLGIAKRAMAAIRTQLGNLAAEIRAQFMRFLRRPDAPRLVAIAVLAIFVLSWPGFVIGMFVTAALIALIVYLSVGPDRIAMYVAGRYEKLKARDPDRAEAIRAKAATVSAKLTSWLERLPDSWTAGLYLPDFEEESVVSEKLKDDPFDRLASQAEIDQGA